MKHKVMYDKILRIQRLGSIELTGLKHYLWDVVNNNVSLSAYQHILNKLRKNNIDNTGLIIGAINDGYN